MKAMKKILIPAVIAVMALSLLAGCGSTNSGSQASAPGVVYSTSSDVTVEQHEATPEEAAAANAPDGSSAVNNQ